MKRLYVSIFIILSLIALDIYSHRLILEEEKDLEENINSIYELYHEKNTVSAYAEAVKLSEKWESGRKKLAVFVSDRTLDEISDSINRIKPLLESESDEVAAEAENIRQKLLRQHTGDLPYMRNIF